MRQRPHKIFVYVLYFGTFGNMSPVESSTIESDLIQNLKNFSLIRSVYKVSKWTRAAAVVSLLSILSIAGCSNKFWDPRQIGRFRPVPAVNVILDTLGVAEETPSVWAGAEEPRPIDVIPYKTDYTFSPGDIISISIFELLQSGAQFQGQYIVTETGKISIPEVGIIEVEGLTEEQLEEEIRQMLSPSILTDPSVTVSLAGSQQHTYSIWGDGISASGRFGLPRYDFRLTDAIATSGGMRQFNVSYVYISRRVKDEESIDEEVNPYRPRQLIEPEKEMLDIISPHAQLQGTALSHESVITTAEMITDRELAELDLPRGFESNDEQSGMDFGGLLGTSEPAKALTEDDESGHVEWIFKDGRWVPIQDGSVTGRQRVEANQFERSVPDHFDWDEIGIGEVNTRVIKIPADKLRAGDPRYNVIIRPGDSIHVPVDVTGEFFIYGNVSRQGIASMQGRPMTLKMAIAAAGGLGPLAWPRKCEVTRRIGEDREETVMVDLDKIANGEQPDFFIKPLDLINVGTHPTSLWRAVLRNSFRATYGFGFVYDRNFLTRDFGVIAGPPAYNPVAPWNWDVVEEGKLFDY